MEYWEVEVTAVRRLIAAHPREFETLLAETEKLATTAAPAQPCRTCKRLHLDRNGIELAALLGHDSLGHRALSALWAAGYGTARDVRRTTDQQLGVLEGLSDTGIARIRYALGIHDLVGTRAPHQDEHPN
ncbi:hypothetical protein ACWDSL_06370 [Streptomyces sp. NPDC000941]